MVDDIGIWKQSLSQNEISNLFYMPNTGIGHIPATESFQIALNPASGYFTVCDIASIAGSRLSVTVYSCVGQLVLEENMNSEKPVIRFTNIRQRTLYCKNHQ
jgi:hypothetical protein